MIYIGTSGYSYKDWIGPFYAQGTKSGDMLSYYSEQFGFTEINSTYYKIPNPFMLYNMQKKTQESFVFTVKLHQSMTHSKNASKQDYKSFIEAVSVLSEVEKLGCLVAQFPYSFYCNKENKEYILQVREQLMDFKLVVEFRNSKWLNNETFMFLKDNNIGFVSVDEPELSGLPDKRCIAVSDTAYIRFHGRNDKKWWEHNEAYERYDYLYNEDELSEWKNKIKSLEQESDSIFVSFNNHFSAQAVTNARMLREMLQA